MRQTVDPYTVSFVVAALLAVFIGIFKSHLFKRLSTRIIALILISGPLTAFLFSSSTRVLIHFDLLSRPGSLATTILSVLITLGTPIVLGLTAAYFVWRPLRHFNDTLSSLKQSNYTVKVQPTGITEFDQTFSEFNELIQRLQHEENLRKDLISDTSHELNTPLTTMVGQLTAMQEGKLAMTKTRVTILKDQADRLVELVQQLNLYTKSRIADATPPEVIPLKLFCEELLRTFRLELENKKIETNTDIARDLTITANRKALQQILTNLIQNSLRYSNATKISITADTQQLLFSDNGIGVPSESLPFLFERFYRVDKSRSRATGGLGLGLAIVRELTEQQGWQISVKAAEPGLTFRLKMHQVSNIK